MLTHLFIRHYALIAQLDIDLHEGFSCLTGETGAGKSIILGALNLVMGGKADARSITEGEDKCVIEATFQTPEGEILIRRELNVQGRSRSFVNDEVVSMAELKTLSARLIDIHSQHENLLLENDDFQISVVDAIAGNSRQRSTYTDRYKAYLEAQKARIDMQTLARNSQADADYVRFQYDQLYQAKLQTGEENELQDEEYRLSHAQDILTALQNAAECLDGEGGVLTLLHACDLRLAHPELEERLRSTEIELKDIAHEVHHRAEAVEMNPERLAWVQERLNTLQELKKKHHVSSVEELITLRDTLEKQTQRLESFDEEIAALQQAEQAAYHAMNEAATVLTKSRLQVCEPIGRTLVQDLQQLGIAHAQVAVDIQPAEAFGENGHDNVQFMFAANLGQSPRRVSEVASGGETARLMLCIKALIASTTGLPTIIFDEIDTGVSGEVALQMGTIMQQIGQTRQVIAITHLPQIAAKATEHFCVYKADTDSHTRTFIRPLSQQERIHEIATMLSGHHPGPEALATAQQLLSGSH